MALSTADNRKSRISTRKVRTPAPTPFDINQAMGQIRAAGHSVLALRERIVLVGCADGNFILVFKQGLFLQPGQIEFTSAWRGQTAVIAEGEDVSQALKRCMQVLAWKHRPTTVEKGRDIDRKHQP